MPTSKIFVNLDTPFQQSLQQKIVRKKTELVEKYLSSHNVPTSRARELFKPSQNAESLQFRFKKLGSFGVKFSCW